MTKKFSFFTIGVLFLIISMLSIVSAAEIGYIVKNSDSVNPIITNIFSEKGLSYEEIKDNTIALTDFSKYSLLFIEGDPVNRDLIPYSSSSVIFFNKRIANEVWGVSYGSTTNRQIKVYDSDSVILEEVVWGGDWEFPVYTSSKAIHYLNTKPSSVSNVAVALGSQHWNDGVITTQINSLTNTRVIFFGLPDADYWTQNSEIMFRNSIDFAISGQDKDKDGFYSEEDCDDNDFDVNPNAIEIEYDGKDNDCIAGDLEDLDGDGYTADCYFVSGFCEVVNGDDCNDSDDSIHPNSPDLSKNCVNDAPILDIINKIQTDEGQNVVLVLNANDSEDDEITYFVNDDRFVKINQNTFAWQTNYDDEGIYFFEIIVSDGELENKENVEVEILNANQPPVCEEIGLIEWDEDDSASLNLNNYCKDNDGEEIEFEVYDTSDNTHVTLTNLINGVAEFDSEQDWNGEDWIRFKIIDESNGETLTNKIMLRVLPINDAPYLNGPIDNITLNEDTNYTDYLNLNEHFSDIDGDFIVFSVVENNHVNIVIDESGMVSFYPESDWYGTETITIKASDGQVDVNYDFDLNVLDTNEPPEFLALDCDVEINEDKFYECELKATDVDGDNFIFSVIYEDNLNCEIENNILTYRGYENYFGSAECMLSVSDGQASDESLLEVNILNINDAPEITSYSPENSPRLLANTNNVFKVTAEDIEGDNNIQTSWIFNTEEVGTGSFYVFNQEEGRYKLKAVVSDGIDPSEHIWDIFVGDISDFTCEEVSGYNCDSDEVCLEGELLGVSDSTSCCSVQCSEKPPEFSDISGRKNKSSEIDIRITNPDLNEEYKIGDTIGVKIEIENRVNKDIDAEVSAYLYDITKDKIIDREKDKTNIDSNNERTISLDIKLDDDLDEGNKYAIFVKVDAENEDTNEDYYNEEYVRIDLERDADDVIIQKFILSREEVVCGDSLEAEIKIINMGSDKQDIIIKLESADLNIYRETEELKIEGYDNDDTINKIFSIQIPEDIKSGNYNLKTSVQFDGYSVFNIKELIVNCIDEKTEFTQTDMISLGYQTANATLNSNSELGTIGKTNNSFVKTAMIIMLIVLILAGIIIFVMIITYLIRLAG